MNRLLKLVSTAAVALSAGGAALSVAPGGVAIDGWQFGRAEARIGRPFTPMSYAGVARRTTRRAVVGGAVVGGAVVAAPYYAAPRYGAVGCVQVVDAYGRIVYRCP
jgi:cytochrome c-type biogenesis protein CcmH/NrfG